MNQCLGFDGGDSFFFGETNLKSVSVESCCHQMELDSGVLGNDLYDRDGHESNIDIFILSSLLC